MNLSDLKNTEYLGDGVYIGSDGHALWIVTHDGIKTTNAICLEMEILAEFHKYLKKWMENR